MSEEGEKLNASMGKFVKELTGVSLTDTNNEFRSTYDVLKEIGEVWSDLDSLEQAMLAEEIAGKNRANVFISIMQNAEQLENAYEALKDSAGSSFLEQQSYMEGLSGRINALKESLTGISMKMMNSDFLKSLVDNTTKGVNVIGGVIDTFGVMPTTIMGVVGAMTVLNSKFRENSDIQLKLMFPGYSKTMDILKQTEQKLISYRNAQLKTIEVNKIFASGIQGSSVSLQGLSLELVKSQGKMILATAGLVSMKIATVALQAAMSMSLSLAISGCISLITKWIGSIETAEKKAQKLSEASQNMATAMSEYSDNSKLLSDYAKIKKQIDDISTTEKERNELNQELSSIKSQLMNMDSQAYAILNNQNIPLERQLELLKHINDEKMREKALELEDSMGKQSEADAMAKDVQIYANTIRNLQDALSKGDGQGIAKILGVGKDFDDAKKAIDDYKAKIENLRADIDVWNSNVKMLKENNLGAELSYVELGDSINDVLDTIIETSTHIDELGNNINEMGQESDDASTSVDRLSSVYESLGYSAKEAGDKIKELSGLSLDDQNAEIMKDATKAYSDSISEMVKLQDLIKDINEEGKLTPNIISSITSSYPEIGSAILDTGDTIDFLNGKIQEQEQIYTQALEIMVADDDKWYANHIANNGDMQNKLRELYSTFISDGADAYDIDLSNYQTLTQLKNALNDDLIDGLADYLKSYIGGNADTYKTDLRMKMRLYTVMYIEKLP